MISMSRARCTSESSRAQWHSSGPRTCVRRAVSLVPALSSVTPTNHSTGSLDILSLLRTREHIVTYGNHHAGWERP